MRSSRTCAGWTTCAAAAAACSCAPKPRSAPFSGPSGVGIHRSAFAPTCRHPRHYQGAHQFRHGLATEMLRQGASLGEIGELLGHRHPRDHEDLHQGRHKVHCAHWLCRGQEVCDEHASTSRSGLSESSGAVWDSSYWKQARGCSTSSRLWSGTAPLTSPTALALAWAQQPVDVQPVHWAQRLSFVRGFSRAIIVPPIHEPRFLPLACCHFDRSGRGRTYTRTMKFEACCALRSTCPAVMNSASCDLGPTIVCLDY